MLFHADKYHLPKGKAINLFITRDLLLLCRKKGYDGEEKAIKTAINEDFIAFDHGRTDLMLIPTYSVKNH